MIYPNCSELIADFCLKTPKQIYTKLKALEKYGVEFEPKLDIPTLELLKSKGIERIAVIDNNGFKTSLQYGDNGYDDSLGFWLADSGNNHGDESQFPLFGRALDDCGAQIRSFDGGSTDLFFQWYEHEHKK